MRLFAFVVAAAFITCAPAEAAWKQYVYKDLGCAVDFPADPKVEQAPYKAGVAGTADSTLYTVMQDGVSYKMTVVDFTKRGEEGATLLEEAVYLGSLTGDVLNNDTARVEPGPRAIYGRRLVIDVMKNGGRTMTTYYFTKGRLFMLQASVPADGDKGSPDLSRFTQSMVFNLATVTKPGGN